MSAHQIVFVLLLTLAIMAWMNLLATLFSKAFLRSRVGQWFDRLFGRIVLAIERAWFGNRGQS